MATSLLPGAGSLVCPALLSLLGAASTALAQPVKTCGPASDAQRLPGPVGESLPSVVQEENREIK